MPNALAYAALGLWPLVTLALFRFLPRPQAIVAAFLSGYLLLPYGAGINLPMIPTMDKTSIPALSVVLALLIIPERRSRSPGVGTPLQIAVVPRQDRRLSRRARAESTSPDIGYAHSALGRNMERLLVLAMFVSPFATVLTNSHVYAIGPSVLPGLTAYDAVSMLLSTSITVIPYLAAKRYLASPETQRLLLGGLVVAGLVYTIPTLAEIRLSPQISIWVYGFLAQAWDQTFRGGGFRPVVFLQHGLWLAIFLCMCTLGAFALWRQRRLSSWFLAGIWLLGVLAAAHSLGALAIAICLLPIVVLVPPRLGLWVAAIVAATIVLYPMVRGSGLVPTSQIVEMANSISVDRGGSLQFRFDNEDILLAHANAQPLFGWGGWARGRAFDPITGADISTTDGIWIITIGDTGWLGYLAQFGLLAGPIIVLAFKRRLPDMTLAAGLALVMAANLIDMIANATLTPITWMLAGSMAGIYAGARPPAPTRRRLPATPAAAPGAAPATPPAYATAGEPKSGVGGRRSRRSFAR